METPLIQRHLTLGIADLRIRPLCEEDLHQWDSLEPGCPRWVTSVLETHVVELRLGNGASPTARDLPIPDRLALLIEVYCTSFGEASYVVVRCPNSDCGCRLDVDFSMRELLEQEEFAERGSCAIVGDCVFPLKWPTGQEQESWVSSAPEFLRNVVESCLAADAPEPEEEDLPAILEELLKILPGPRFSLPVECVQCEVPFRVPVKLADHFHTQMDRVLEEVEHDIHLLASAYHWSEEAILKLPRRRRKRYVSRLEGAWT